MVLKSGGSGLKHEVHCRCKDDKFVYVVGHDCDQGPQVPAVGRQDSIET